MHGLGLSRADYLTIVGRSLRQRIGRSWKCTAIGFVPLPPSISHGVRSPLAVHKPRPFQPAFGSSMRPSKPLA